MEAEGEDGEKPEMAESETQKLTEAEINEPNSFLLTRNLLGAATFDINRYIRGLFPEKYFNDESIPGLDTKLITPMDAESRRLFDWMEKGVYDALQRKYLKTLIFCIGETEDDGPMIEKYGLSFSYSDSGSQEVIIRTENKKHGGASSSNQRRTSACQMVRTLAELMRNLDKMPDKRTIELTTTVDATKSPQDLYSAGKVSPGGSFDAGVAETYAFIDSVLKDNKCEFVSLLKRHFVGEDLESERSQALKLLSACCGYDALNCASSIINGYLRSVPYINDIAADTGLSPLHTAAEANSPRCVEMLLKRRTRTDMRSKDERALLPLELSLCNGSLEVPWNPSGDSIADLIRLLVDKDLTVVKLLAEKTKDVDVVAHAFARAGAILPFTALLIVESDKIREATVALQDDDSASKSGKLTIYESLIQEAIQMQSVRSQKRMLLLREIELLQLFGAAVFSDIGNEQTSLISIVQVRLGYLSL